MSSSRPTPAAQGLRGALFALILLATAAFAGSARAATTLTFATPISGDVVPVTLSLADGEGGDRVEITLSIPQGEGDLLGLFGNVVDESLVDSMAVDDPTGIVTQWQFRVDRVKRVGGGNVMAPVKKWDWGLKLGQTGSGGGMVTSASFALTGPGLTADELLAAVNQGWVFGVRIQSTNGAEGSSKLGLSGDAPRIRIQVPEEGALLAAAPTAVSGTVLGSGVAADVNGVAATVGGGAFDADVPLAEGPNTLLATATNAQGTATDAVDVVLDTTPPVVTITDPPDGTLTAAAEVLVQGTATDASPIESFTLNGEPVALTDGAFEATVPLAFGENPITAEATDAAGHVGSDAIAVVRGEPPTVAIASPADGALVPPGTVAVSGTVTGTPAPTVEVNGAAAPVAGGSFSASVPVAEGENILTATASNAVGGDTASVTVTAGLPPTVQITAPADGLLTAESPATVTGTVTGTAPLSVEVNGVAAPVAGGSFTASVPLAEGGNTLAATASNLFGSAEANVSVTLDTTPPVVAISSPVDGTRTVENQVAVQGTVIDASPIASVTLNGQPVSLDAGTFTAQLSIPLGDTPITAVAEDAAGNSGSDSVGVTRGEPPAVMIVSPADGSTIQDASASASVTGTVGGTAPLSVDVNGVVAEVAGGSFQAVVSLDEGANPIVATAQNEFGETQDTVTVERATASQLSVVIETPPDGELVSSETIAVTGRVSDEEASVQVNGVAARVDGTRWVAPAVRLEEGENLLQATGSRASDTATDSSTVVYNAPPQVMITSPRNGARLRVAETDVEGFVDEPAAFVDVNGVDARVGSAGRFLAPAVPLQPGGNELEARAIDPFGATGRDEVTVTRDDASVGRMRVVFVMEGRDPLRPFGAPSEPELPVIAEDGQEFEEALRSLGFQPEEFDPAVEAPAFGSQTFEIHLFVFTEAGTLGEDVSVPALTEEFFTFPSQQPLQPMSQLDQEIGFVGLDPDAYRKEIVPEDFAPNGFVHFVLHLGVPQ